jgi:hypothetical protein
LPKPIRRRANCCCVGQYQLVPAALNACRVERDDGLDPTQIPFPPPAD